MMRKFEFVLNCDFRGRWRQKREQYRYAQDEYRGPQMGGFGGRHCK